jgi:hypothetical protein
VAGGDSFDGAVLIEPGRTYRLKDHLAPGKVAYFAFDAAGGRKITATVRTGSKGVMLSHANAFEELTTPFAGVALADSGRDLVGQRVDVLAAPYSTKRLEYTPRPEMGGRYYLLVGAQHAAQHRDAEFSVEVQGHGPPTR